MTIDRKHIRGTVIPGSILALIALGFCGFVAAQTGERTKVDVDVWEKLADGVPPGTIMAFAGDAVFVREYLKKAWVVCDGAAFPTAETIDTRPNEYRRLYEAIGYNWGSREDGRKFRVPDLRGYFLRGVDNPFGDSAAGNDPESTNRDSQRPGGGNGGHVGSKQPYATALPTSTPLDISENGNHTHTFHVVSDDKGGSDDHTAAGDANADRGFLSTTPAGNHKHTLSGGDKETRPKNVYVNWIIRK